MSKFILIILMFVTTVNVSASWKLKTEYGNTEIYISENSTRLTLNFRKTVPKIKKFDKKLIEGISKEKKELLKMIGISKWEINETQIKREGEISSILLKGKYTDNKGVIFHFIESHMYSSSNKLQILLTNISKKELEKDSQKSNIKGFKIKYGFY